MGEQDMKTLSLIAVAGLASAAAADQMWAANPSSSFSNQQSGFASGTYDYNFGETAHWDLQGDPDNVVVTLDLNALLGGAAGADAFVTGIGWDVTVTTTDPSWLSEATYNFNGEIFVTPGIGEDVPGTNSYSSGGILDLGDNALPDILAAGGILTIEFFDSFDDFADAIDGFSSGTLTLAVDYKVPAPAGLAVLGLGGLVATRRRR
jgi:hypothetical protein